MRLDVQDIIQQVDIVEYVGQYTELEKQSNGDYLGICPLHEEKTASFSVTQEAQLFYCFGCSVGGDVLTFIKQYHKCTTREAVNILKKYANVTDNVATQRLSATKVIKKFKRQQNKKVSARHTLLDDNVMDQYERNKEKLKVWLDEGISYEALKKYQVRYDVLSNRLVYPVRDINGNIISVCGRTLEEDYKAKKIRKYTYFQSLGTLDTIFGYYENLENIQEQNEIILFEGAKSVMLCDTWGIHNVGAILTSHLNLQQVKILVKLGTTVVFALDKGINIKDDKNINKLKHYVRVEYIQDNELLQEKESPVDRGFEVWKQLYEKRRRLN